MLPLFWLSSVLAFCLSRPPPPLLERGSVYSGSVRVLSLPTQFVSIKVVDEGVGSLHLSGVLNADGRVGFCLDEEDRVSFVFDDAVKRKMERRFCKVVDATYDKEKDVASVSVSIAPLRIRKTVNLTRVLR
mgnify:CR=1 FL=1